MLSFVFAYLFVVAVKNNWLGEYNIEDTMLFLVAYCLFMLLDIKREMAKK